MTKMIQIRNVSPKVHRELKARAALAGMSLSEYLLRQLEEHLRQPTRDELLERLARLPHADLTPAPAEVIRAERDGR